jgi:hypothetical protein
MGQRLGPPAAAPFTRVARNATATTRRRAAPSGAARHGPGLLGQLLSLSAVRTGRGRSAYGRPGRPRFTRGRGRDHHRTRLALAHCRWQRRSAGGYAEGYLKAKARFRLTYPCGGSRKPVDVLAGNPHAAQAMAAPVEGEWRHGAAMKPSLGPQRDRPEHTRRRDAARVRARSAHPGLAHRLRPCIPPGDSGAGTHPDRGGPAGARGSRDRVVRGTRAPRQYTDGAPPRPGRQRSAHRSGTRDLRRIARIPARRWRRLKRP